MQPKVGQEDGGGRKMFEPKCNAASPYANVLHVVGDERLKDERLENGEATNVEAWVTDTQHCLIFLSHIFL